MNELPLIAVGFARRQTPSSRFTHWTCSDAELVAIAEANLADAYDGYQGSETKHAHLPHNGICLVPVPEDKLHLIRCGVVVLEEGDKLAGGFEARRDGEEPRKFTVAVNREKGTAANAQIILYHREVLEADGEKTIATWEIVSVNSSPTKGEPPISAGVLMANHFGQSGGTGTGLTSAEFEAKLRASSDWWKDKAFAGKVNVAYCCDFMEEQLNYICDQHGDGADCPDVAIGLGSGSGKLFVVARNATYACNYCPGCGTPWVKQHEDGAGRVLGES